MKELVKQVKSLIIFNFPIQAKNISVQFAATHQKFQLDTPEWSTEATRQKMISHYWYSYVPRHFAALIGLPVLLVIAVQSIAQWSFYRPGIFIAGLLSYLILYVCHYRMEFSSFFLPRLETVKAAYEFNERTQSEKCRRAQMSNFALTLFFYVFTRTNNMRQVSCDDQSAALLTKLFGVDSGSIKKNLELILGTLKRKSISDRKITEIKNRFNEIFEFFEEIDFKEGLDNLKMIEMKILNKDYIK